MSRYIDYDAIDYRNDKMHDKSSDFMDGVVYMAQRIEEAPSIDICFCEECMFADEEPIADGRYWCALHQCFMRFCSEGKEESRG